jgi:putative AdoMet-dependent methyltransferase
MVERKWDFDSWAKNYDQSVLKTDWIHENYSYAINFVCNEIKQIAQKSLKSLYVLDIGAGTGNLIAKIVSLPNIVLKAIEPSKQMRIKFLEKCKNIEIVPGLLPKIPVKDNTFDILVATYVIHHIPSNEIGVMVQEFRRVLKRSGTVIIVDAMFESQNALALLKKELENKGDKEMIEEIEDEYFPLVDNLKTEFVKSGFYITIHRLGTFTWYLQANINK